MATLQLIVFFLACAFLLQEIQTQRTDFHYQESSDKSSSTASSNEGFKREISMVNDKTNAVMMNACAVMRSLNLECVVGNMNRRFISNIVQGLSKHFVNFQLKVLYGLVTLCERIIQCIKKVISYIVNVLIEAFPPCTQKKLRAVKHLFKDALQLITATLRTIYDFSGDITRCVLSLGECIRAIYEQVMQAVMNIFKNLITKVTEVTTRVLRLNKGCPKPPPRADPEVIMVQFSSCFLCCFKPGARMCG